MNKALLGHRDDPHQAHDISNLVQKAIEELEDGQLIHNETFTLWEAMSACEIMDPRMDSGMILDSQIKQPEFKLYAKLLPEEVLWIMDRTFACEMSWHAGNSLAQTIFTCMYLHQIIDLTQHNFEAFHQTYPVRHHGAEPHTNGGIHSADEPPGEFVYLVLKAYLVGLLRCCYHVWEEMSKGNLYEEEDFVTHRFGLSLLEDISDSTVLNLLDDAQYWMSSVGKNWNASHSQASLNEAIIVRLRLRKSFLLSFKYLEEPLCEDYPKAVQQLRECQSFLLKDGNNVIKKTANLGKTVKGAFDLNIIRKLASQAPPRPIETFTVEEAANKLESFLVQSMRMCRVLDCRHPESVMAFLFFFAFEQPPCFPYARSKLQTTVISENRVLGKQSIYQLVRDSIVQFSNTPPAVFLGDGQGGARDELYANVTALIEQISRPYIDAIKILCHNRARQQRMLGKVLGEWEIVQGDAESVDAQVHAVLGLQALSLEGETAQYPYLISSWIFHIKLQVMEQILMLGFELDLYQPHEYRMIYWYLVYLLELHVGHIDRTAGVVTFYGQRAMGQVGATSPGGRLIYDEMSRTLATLMYYGNRNRAHLEMCQGMLKMLCGLDKLGIAVSRQSLEFDNERLRYERRFKNMRLLASPPFLEYEQYEASKAVTAPGDVLLQDASRHFDACKVALTALMRHVEESGVKSPAENCKVPLEYETQQLVKTCISNTITISNARDRIVIKDSRDGIEAGDAISNILRFGIRYHPWYPVIEVDNKSQECK